MSTQIELSRREAIRAASSSLLVGFIMSASGSRALAAANSAGALLAPNAFVRIGRDSGVTIICKHLEMGQGIETGLAMILAEELDADWAAVKVESAPADAELYSNLAIPGLRLQLTGGSNSTLNSYTQLREAGAMTRALIVQAAAKQWRVPADEITVSRGTVGHASSRRKGRFGDFVALARGLPVPEKVETKDPANFSLIGKPIKRLDTLDKITGKTRYTADILLPGMVYTAIRRPNHFGAVARKFDASKAMAVPGVRHVVQVSTGVAVIADSQFAALAGRAGLTVQWDETNAEKRSSSQLFSEYRELAGESGSIARKSGDFDVAMNDGATLISEDYDLPYLAHAPMEPLNCIARLTEEGCELWYGSQYPTGEQRQVGALLGVPEDKIIVHVTPTGGSFGRRGTLDASATVTELVEVAQTLPRGVPVKTQWTRRDDLIGGHYRPMSYHRIRAAVQKNGRITGWHHRLVVQSIGASFGMPSLIKNGVDPISVRNAVSIPYDVPHQLIELHSPEVGVPVKSWRSVGASYNVFVIESFIDKIAHTMGADPLDLRRSMLSAGSKLLPLLDFVVERIGWKRKTPNRAQGLAIATWAGSYIAMVADVSRSGASFKVEKLECVIDCGLAINPNLVHAQLEGATGFALSAALTGEITLNKGIPIQDSFRTYTILRMSDMPPVVTHIFPSSDKPTGVGETAVPVVAPSIANAVFALTGTPVTHLPMKGLFNLD